MSDNTNGRDARHEGQEPAEPSPGLDWEAEAKLSDKFLDTPEGRAAHKAAQEAAAAEKWYRDRRVFEPPPPKAPSAPTPPVEDLSGSALQDFVIETLPDAPSGDVGLDMDTPETRARDARREASWGTDETSPNTHPDDLPGGSLDPGTPAPAPLIDRKWRVPPLAEPDARVLPDVGRMLEQLPSAGILMGVGLTLILLVAFCGAPALFGDRSAPGVAAPAAPSGPAVVTNAAGVPTSPTPSPRRTAAAEPPVRVVAAVITYRFHDTYCEYQAFATWTLEGAKLGDVYEFRWSQGSTSHPVQRFVMSGELFDPATGKLTVPIGGLPDDSPGHTAELIMVRSQPPEGNGTVTAPPMACPNRR